ncbi:ribosomal-processing cysteine protease Prp [Streptomyces sp. NBC_00340]|uniref:ribosomal-processing cysteine protease Prp n=1 Tax=Streptomyces sp. NBC_00340 TaxID=2975716 RepID=UPI00225AD154|nr:ribosomal-processing cysteine protease Prp [Streptomyces sp. NBC_00340]MCX5137585.1 ribosomal-processing cysteine protease Prp [Streptomyces sp. NBC_00340]
MIRIRARMGDGRTFIEVDGHEEHVEGGRVCAAVSAITQTALLGLEQVALQHPDLVSVEITQE